jgi:hypothetical protein
MKQSDLGEYEKMQEKNKIYNIQVKSTNSPSNQVIWMANTNSPTPANQQIEKNQGIW